MDETSNDAAAAPVTPVKKKGGGFKKILLAFVALVAVGGIGGGAWWWLNRPTVEAAEPPLSERGLVTFEPFLVNLADAGGTRFLKCSIQLVLGSVEEAKHVQETSVVLMLVRSAVLEILTQQSATALVTTEGKQALKAAIKEKAGTLLHDQKVIDVLFSEFVVQF